MGQVVYMQEGFMTARQRFKLRNSWWVNLKVAQLYRIKWKPWSKCRTSRKWSPLSQNSRRNEYWLLTPCARPYTWRKCCFVSLNSHRCYSKDARVPTHSAPIAPMGCLHLTPTTALTARVTSCVRFLYLTLWNVFRTSLRQPVCLFHTLCVSDQLPIWAG